MVGERGFTLSGGQRQRLSIARTLLVNPPILVLDDATSAIDVQIEQQIHEALRELMVDRTTLIIAHRLSTISLADRVAVVEDGRIIAQGTHTELLATEPRYAEILAQGDPDVDLEAEAASTSTRSRPTTSSAPASSTPTSARCRTGTDVRTTRRARGGGATEERSRSPRSERVRADLVEWCPVP